MLTRKHTIFVAVILMTVAIACSKPVDETSSPEVVRATTPLHEVARDGRMQSVESFLADGADPNALDETGKTPLHHAAANGHGGTCTALIQAGADPAIKDDTGITAMSYAISNGHPATADAIRSAGGLAQRPVSEASPDDRLNPSLRYRDLASFETAIDGRGLLLKDENVWLFAPQERDTGANTVFPYLVRAYDELRSIVGVDTEYIIVVYNFPPQHKDAFGGTSNCTIYYDDHNLRLDKHEEWTTYGVPHVSGYIEEMAHNFVHTTRAQFGWEMLGWSIGAIASERVAQNSIHSRHVANTRRTQAETFRRYKELGHVFPDDIESNLVDRIHAHLLYECEKKYGGGFWPDFFEHVRSEAERLAHPDVTGGDDAYRNARYQITVACFDRLAGLNFKALLEENGISLSTDVKSLHPMNPDWNRRLV